MVKGAYALCLSCVFHLMTFVRKSEKPEVIGTFEFSLQVLA